MVSSEPPSTQKTGREDLFLGEQNQGTEVPSELGLCLQGPAMCPHAQSSCLSVPYWLTPERVAPGEVLWNSM